MGTRFDQDMVDEGPTWEDAQSEFVSWYQA